MFATLNNQDLLMRTRDLVGRERALCAQLMLHLGEVDARKLYADEGYPSMFKFMVDGLKYSEAAAVRRLAAARISRRYPMILDLLKEGRIHLTALQMLAKVISDANAERLLTLCGGKSKIQIEAIILQEAGELAAPKREVVRVVPTAAPTLRPEPQGAANFWADQNSKSCSEEIPKADIRVAFTLDKTNFDKLKRAQRISGAAGIAEIVTRAIDLFLEQKDQNIKLAKTPRKKSQVLNSIPSPAKVQSKQVPMATKRAVMSIDGGRCSYVEPKLGIQCSETCRLEFDHIQPRALGGSNDVTNIRLLCRAHNLLAARTSFGTEFMERYVCSTGKDR